MEKKRTIKQAWFGNCAASSETKVQRKPVPGMPKRKAPAGKGDRPLTAKELASLFMNSKYNGAE